MNKETKTSSTALSQLRAIIPARSLQLWEAKRIAETQAARLRIILDATDANFDTNNLARLPRVNIERSASLLASGSTTWQAGSWRVRLKSTEALVRQRFTVAHELKHIIDAPDASRMYSAIRDRIDGERQVEAICDYFAACLLMPKRWVKRLWGEGNRELVQLAEAFDVSPVAMKRRLEHLGIVPRPNRHQPHSYTNAPQSSDALDEPVFFRAPPLPVLEVA